MARPDPAIPVSEAVRTAIADSDNADRIAVLYADLKGKITACNEAAANVFSCARGEIVGKSLTAFVTGEDEARQRQLLETVLTALN